MTDIERVTALAAELNDMLLPFVLGDPLDGTSGDVLALRNALKPLAASAAAVRKHADQRLYEDLGAGRHIVDGNVVTVEATQYRTQWDTPGLVSAARRHALGVTNDGEITQTNPTHAVDAVLEFMSPATGRTSVWRTIIDIGEYCKTTLAPRITT